MSTPRVSGQVMNDASPSEPGAMVRPTHPPPVDDMEVKKRRRRAQNRRNQKARRLRMQGQHRRGLSGTPFEVACWRLGDEEEDTQPRRGSKSTPLPSSRPDMERKSRDSTAPSGRTTSEAVVTVRMGPGAGFKDRAVSFPWTDVAEGLKLEFSLSQNRLVRLVQLNVFHSFVETKHAIEPLAQHFLAQNNMMTAIPPFDENYRPYRAVLMPTVEGGLGILAPTWLQRSITHPTWMDLIPFSRMRDNLISLDKHFDHVEFLSDLIGDNLDVGSYYRPAGRHRHHRRRTSAQTGLVVWGDPCRIDNWEVTPGFLYKWPWALEGCQDLVDSSNRWRAIRGEDSLVDMSLIPTGLGRGVLMEGTM